MTPNPITDQSTMEFFFNSQLSLFPNAKRLLTLKIFPHEAALVISHAAVLVKYEITLEMEGGENQTIVLRGSSDPQGKRLKAYHILTELWGDGFDQGPFVVPRPVGYFENYHLLLYENSPGQSLMQNFEQGNNHYEEKVDRALAWLIAFHETRLKNIPEAHFRWEEEREEFRSLTEALRKKFAGNASRISGLATTLMECEEKLLNPDRFCLVHGDFQPNNILIKDDSTSVIDFNDAFLYDELFDIVHFCVQTKFMLSRLRHLDVQPKLDQALAAYLKARQIEKNQLTDKKIALFSAKTLLRIKILTSHHIAAGVLEEIESYVQKAI